MQALIDRMSGEVMCKIKLDPRKYYEFKDFDVTQAAVDFLRANAEWKLYGQKTRDRFTFNPWTQTKLFREVEKYKCPGCGSENHAICNATTAQEAENAFLGIKNET